MVCHTALRSEQVRDLREEANIAGRILFLLLVRSNVFFVFFAKEKEGSNNSLWTSRLRLGLRTRPSMGLHSGTWRTKRKNTSMCL